MNPALEGGAILITKPDSDVVDGLSLEDWTDGEVQFLKISTPFKDAKFGESKHLRIADRDVIQVGFDAVVKTFKVHYVYTYFKSGSYFCHLDAFAPPSHADELGAAIESLLKAVR